MNNLWLAFLTGLTTGGISCLAVQGGLLASSIATKKETSALDEAQIKRYEWKFVSVFLIVKLIAYTFLGFSLGLLGSMLTLTPQMTGWLQIFAGLFMIGTALRLLDAHPLFRYLVIAPPKSVYKLMRRYSKDPSFFTPAFLGGLTVLMPCGVTQAMMVSAIASGNAVFGAALMFAFTLGTSPIFLVLGATLVQLLERKAFAYVAAVIVFVFGVASLNGGMGLTGSAFTLQNIYKAATTDIETLTQTSGKIADVSSDGRQEVTVQVSSYGYTTNASTLEKGKPVRLKLITNKTQGCARAFTIPALNVSKILPETGTEYLEFTPQDSGRLAFSCSMGMYTGEFNVI